MDTTKWKSVLVPKEIYDEIKKLSKDEGRTISGQLRLVFDYYKKKQPLTPYSTKDQKIPIGKVCLTPMPPSKSALGNSFLISVCIPDIRPSTLP